MFNDHEDHWIKTSGWLDYDERFVRITVHDDFICYYNSLIKKEFNINTNLPAHRGHITIVNPTFHGKLNRRFLDNHIKKYGKLVPFYYNTNITIGKGTSFFNFLFMAKSNEITYLRKNCAEIEDDNFHLTICNTKGLPLDTRKLMRKHIIYAGIGSRAIPPKEYQLMKEYAKKFAQYKFILRSGGAPGSDTAAEEGCDEVGGYKEIFLPWKGFNGNMSNRYFDGPREKEFFLAKKYHPGWKKLSDPAKLLIARNGNQILGEDLETPVDFVLCYTNSGGEEGGTGQGYRIAQDMGIPIYNLGKKGDREKLDSYIERLMTFL